MVKRSNRVEVTQDYVLSSIVGTMERCKLESDFLPASVMRGAELLGKHLGMFSDRLELSGPNGGPIETVTAEMDSVEAARAYEATLSSKHE